MRRLLTCVATGFHMAAFTVTLLIASPVILFHFGVSAIRDGIEERWPDSERARAVSFWLGLLAPLMLLVAGMVALGFFIAHVQALKHAERG